MAVRSSIGGAVATSLAERWYNGPVRPAAKVRQSPQGRVDHPSNRLLLGRSSVTGSGVAPTAVCEGVKEGFTVSANRTVGKPYHGNPERQGTKKVPLANLRIERNVVEIWRESDASLSAIALPDGISSPLRRTTIRCNPVKRNHFRARHKKKPARRDCPVQGAGVSLATIESRRSCATLHALKKVNKT